MALDRLDQELALIREIAGLLTAVGLPERGRIIAWLDLWHEAEVQATVLEEE